MSVPQRWLWVSLPTATFAIGIENGKVVSTCPYMWKLIHHAIKSDDETAVAEFLKKKNAYVEEMNP
jgi:hypothetical protein